MSSTRARAVGQAAGIQLFAGDADGAGRLAREAIEVARAADATSEEAFALVILGWSEALTGDVEGGVATYRTALAAAERLGGVEGIALGHANLAALFDRVGATGPEGGTRDYGFTFSDLTQRLLPAIVLDAYPSQPVRGGRALEVARAITPTPPFRDSADV